MITILLFTIAGVFNAVMDTIAHKYYSSIFSNLKNPKFIKWSDPNSWTNKWENDDKSQGEKFIGSSTVFVWITDLWHFSKMMMILLISFGTIFYSTIINPYIDVLLLYVVFTTAFEITYSYILQQK